MITLDSFIRFLPFFALALIGALFNDFYQTLTDAEERINVPRILLSAMTGALIVLGFSNHVTKFVDSNMFMLLNFGAGATGFKLFKKIKTMDLLDMLMKAGERAIKDKYKDEDSK